MRALGFALLVSLLVPSFPVASACTLVEPPALNELSWDGRGGLWGTMGTTWGQVDLEGGRLVLGPWPAEAVRSQDGRYVAFPQAIQHDSATGGKLVNDTCGFMTPRRLLLEDLSATASRIQVLVDAPVLDYAPYEGGLLVLRAGEVLDVKWADPLAPPTRFERPPPEHEWFHYGAAVASPDGRWLITTGDGSARVFLERDGRAFVERARFEPPREGQIPAAVFSPNSGEVAVFSGEPGKPGALHRLDPRTGSTLDEPTVTPAGDLAGLSWGPGGIALLVDGEGERPALFEMAPDGANEAFELSASGKGGDLAVSRGGHLAVGLDVARSPHLLVFEGETVRFDGSLEVVPYPQDAAEARARQLEEEAPLPLEPARVVPAPGLALMIVGPAFVAALSPRARCSPPGPSP